MKRAVVAVVAVAIALPACTGSAERDGSSHPGTTTTTAAAVTTGSTGTGSPSPSVSAAVALPQPDAWIPHRPGALADRLETMWEARRDVVRRWVHEDHHRRQGSGVDAFDGRALGRAVQQRLLRGVEHVVVPREGVPALLLVDVAGRLVAQPPVHRVGVGVELGREGVQLDLDASHGASLHAPAPLTSVPHRSRTIDA